MNEDGPGEQKQGPDQDEATARVGCGCLIAPLAAGIVASLTAAILGDDPILGSAGRTANILSLFLWGILFGYFSAIVFGAPTYFLVMRRGKLTSVWAYLSVSFALGVLLYELVVGNLIGPLTPRLIGRELPLNFRWAWQDRLRVSFSG